MNIKPFIPPGPIAARAYACRDFITLLMGPVGSAKTTTLLAKLRMQTAWQRPSPVDNVRRIKCRVLRDTYGNVKATTLQSWLKLVPETMGHYTYGGPNSMTTHKIRWGLPDKTICELWMEFMGAGELSAEEIFSSWEGTYIYLNETNLLDEAVFVEAIARLGRYPGGDHGPATHFGIVADLNAPSVTNWTYKLISKMQAGRIEAMLAEADIDPKDIMGDLHTGLASFFRQPGGRDPGAENLKNLPKGYYKRQVATFTLAGKEEMITTKVDNQFGPSRAGKPVYKNWRDIRHVAPDIIDPIPDIPIMVGADQGLIPAAILLQEAPSGQILVLDEIGPKRDETWDGQEFSENLMRLKRTRYAGFMFQGCADMASKARSAAAAGKPTWLSIVKANTDFPWLTPNTNDIDVRLSAVRTNLARLIDGEPGMMVSPACEILREGFNSGYCFPKRSGGGDEYGENPAKNYFANFHDALQYGCLGLGLHYDIVGRNRPGQGSGTPIIAPFDFSVL